MNPIRCTKEVCDFFGSVNTITNKIVPIFDKRVSMTRSFCLQEDGKFNRGRNWISVNRSFLFLKLANFGE